MRTSTALLLCLLTTSVGCSTVPDSQAPPAPQLGVFSRSTATTAEGTLEFEGKVNFDPGDRLAVPLRFKYGLDEATEGYIDVSPLNYAQRDGTDDVVGFGDLRLGVRNRFFDEKESQTSGAVQTELKLPTGKDEGGISTGEFDFLAAAMVTKGFTEKGEATAYYEIGLLGDPTGSGIDLQHLIALKGHWWFSDETAFFGEFANFYGANDIDPVYLDVGLARQLSDETVIELIGVFGLNDDAADAAMVLSVTTNFGELGGSSKAN